MLDKICAVYRVFSSKNNRSYIGSSNHANHRRDQHFYGLRHGNHPSKMMLDDFSFYGESSFIFQILEHIDDPNNLLKREQWWIDTLHPEYNLAPFTDNHLPKYIPDDIIKTKISKTVKELWQDPIYREKHCKPRKWKNGIPNRKGVILSDETKDKIRQASLGKNNPNYGKPRTEETKRKQSLSHTKPNKYPGAISPDGTIYAPINNMSAFCREHDLGVSEMISVMHQRRKAHKGWTLYRG